HRFIAGNRIYDMVRSEKESKNGPARLRINQPAASIISPPKAYNLLLRFILNNLHIEISESTFATLFLLNLNNNAKVLPGFSSDECRFGIFSRGFGKRYG